MVMSPLQPRRVRQENEVPPVQRALKPIPLTQLKVAETTVYTAGDTFDFLIRQLWAANVTAGNATYSIWMVPSGSSTGSANLVVSAQALNANETVKIESIAGSPFGSLLQPGMSLVAACDVDDAVNIGGWGQDILGGEL